MTEKLIKTIRLNNYLELNLIDASSKIAGDRRQVCMVARMNIPVNDNPIFLNDKSMDDFKLFRSSVGEKVGFEQKRVCNFIDAKQKESVLQKLVESFLQAALAYLSHPDFSKKYVLKRYQEFLKKKTWGYQ